MIRQLKAAAGKVGLQLRLTKCRWAQARRRDQTATRPPETCSELLSMAEVADSQATRVLGAEVHMQADHVCESEKTVAKTWAAFHLKAPL